MHNLSLQMTQAASLKKTADTSGKGNTNVDKSVSAEQNTPFQRILSRQVQAQQAPANETPVSQATANVVTDKQSHVEVAHKSKAKTSHAQHAIAVTSNKKHNDKNDSDIDVDSISSLSKMSIESVKSDLKTLPATKEEVDTKPANVAMNTTDSSNSNIIVAPMMNIIPMVSAQNAPVLSSVINTTPPLNTQAVSATLIPVMNTAPQLNAKAATAILPPEINAIPQVNTQAVSAIPEANISSQMSPIPEGIMQKSQSLDAVLSSVLSQNKNINVPEKSTYNSQTIDSKNIGDDKLPVDQTRWLDSVLPTTTKQALSDEPTIAKPILNSLKDVVSKEAMIKDVVMPASYQPAAQVSTSVAMQQTGSTNNINAYPGKTGWDQAISQKVVWMVGAGEQSATLTLNPPDLGPLQVVIHVHNDQADTTFISDNAEVRQALQDGMSNLRDKMSESGIALGQANVSSGEQSQQQFQAAAQQRGSVSQSNNNTSTLSVEKTTTTNTVVRESNGLVDTFA